MATLVELLVELPGFGARVGRFRREGLDLVLAEPLEWSADRDGTVDHVVVSPPDGAWREVVPIRCPVPAG